MILCPFSARPWSSSVHSTLAMYDAGGGALELKRRIEALFQQQRYPDPDLHDKSRQHPKRIQS